MTEAEERRRLHYDHTGRTPQDYAIEHAGYMADAARHLLDAEQEVAALEELDPADAERLNNPNYEIDLDEARDRRNEAFSTLRGAIYEFEKRRDRAADSSAGSYCRETAQNASSKLLGIEAGASMSKKMPHWPILYAILRPAIVTGNAAVRHHAQRLAEVLESNQRAALRELLDRPAATVAAARVVYGAAGAQEGQHE